MRDPGKVEFSISISFVILTSNLIIHSLRQLCMAVVAGQQDMKLMKWV